MSPECFLHGYLVGEGEHGEVDLELTDLISSKTDKSPFHGQLSVLLEWHKSDPVSEEERLRNNLVFTFQKDRNPYIDHPEFVLKIWGMQKPKEKIIISQYYEGKGLEQGN